MTDIITSDMAEDIPTTAVDVVTTDDYDASQKGCMLQATCPSCEKINSRPLLIFKDGGSIRCRFCGAVYHYGPENVPHLGHPGPMFCNRCKAASAQSQKRALSYPSVPIVRNRCEGLRTANNSLQERPKDKDP